MSKFACRQSPDAESWLETCRPLFYSDLEVYNIPHGFGQAVINPTDPSSRFAFVVDLHTNAVIQGIIKAKDSWPTIFSIIKDCNSYDMDEIAKVIVEYLCPSESLLWQMTDCIGPIEFMETFSLRFNARQTAVDRNLVLWRREKWNRCDEIKREVLENVEKSSESLNFHLATLDQVPELIPLRREFLRLLTTHVPSDHEIETWIKSTIAKEKLYILERQTEIVSISASGRETEKAEAVIMVFTPDKYRGQGLATHLVVNVSKRLLNRGKVPLLSVDQRNTAAVRLYDKIGYKPLYEAAHYCIPALMKDVDGN